MVFLRKFLYGICLSRTHRRYKNAKNRSLDRFVYSDIPGIGRFLRWWTRSMPLFLGGTDDRRSRLKLRKLELAIRNYGTFENFIAKSLAGFTFGVILTYGLYFLFVFPLNFSFAGATLWCVIIGFISTLGLAFSEYFRSIALLSLPSFFSGKGRQALTTYAVILAVTGPGKNSLTNVRVLSDSIGCSQERVRKSLRDVFQLTKNPYAAIKQSLSVVIARIMEIAKKIEAITSTIKKSVLSMDQVLIAASESMSKVAAICQSKGKHPYTTCIRALKKNHDDCRVSLKCIFGGLCKSDDLPNSMCNRFRKVESVCSLPSDPSNEISKRVHMKLSAFFRRLHNLMTFKLTKSHELHYELRKNREVDVVNAIATDIRELTASILYLFDSISVLFSFFYFYLFYSVITFRNKYLAHEWYENRYITSNLLLIEMRRMRQKKATIFPLSRIESQKYIKINSLNLGTMDVYEMYNMIIRSVALFIKISLHMAADYGLWWLIMECRRAANHIQVPEGMSNVKVQTCRADGLSGEIYNEIANAFQPNRFNFTTDMTSCLPEPSAPDIKRNITIMLIGVLTVIIGFVEPYGTRLKVSIMNFYYPIIARRRSVWLYNHIIRTRNSFTRVARRRLRREYGRWDRKDSETAAFMYRFRCDIGSKMPFATLRRMVTPMDKKYNRCILCKTYGAPDDPLTSCVTPGCKGTYCLECFANLQNICTICLTPLQYNDVSDMSEEKDSSDDEGKTSVKKCLDKALSDKTMGTYSSESEASTVGSHDFDPEVDGVRPNVNVEQYDLEDFPFAPQAFTCHDKEKDWATMQDFELPKGEATQYAIAEQGIAMTLSHRIRTGFSGLIFAKPVFGRAAETENMYDSTDHTIKTGNVSETECLSRGSAIRRTLGCVPKKLLTFAKRRMLRSLNVRGKHEFCRTSPSRSGSGASSRRSLPGHISKLSINPPENHDNFRFLERGSKRSDRLLQVYYGLHMTNSEYQRVKSCSGSEIEEQSEGSSVLEVITTKSVTWSTDRRYSQNESSRLGDTMTSRVYDSSSTSSQCAWSKREAATTDTIPVVTRQEPHTEGVQTRLEEMPAPVVQGRLSFRNIKAQPTKSQVTHKMFHVDESE